MKQLHLRHLRSGGLITNYHCTSSCAHCLYHCSSRRPHDYIDAATAGRCLAAVISRRCSSIHIGGGEPFLNIDGLVMVLRLARSMGVGVEYVETNSSWFTDEKTALFTLERLRAEGLKKVLVSISPFHNEHIPFYKVRGVMKACIAAGVDILPWVADFIEDISAFDDLKTHSLHEYSKRYGVHYIKNIPGRYWVHYGGRARTTFREYLPLHPVKEIIEKSRGGCRELEDVSHFHVDLYGNYIPGLCTGLAVSIDDLDEPIRESDYPAISMLYGEGVGVFMESAVSAYGFTPRPAYVSRCHLCDHIRHFLVKEKGFRSRELQPLGFYER